MEDTKKTSKTGTVETIRFVRSISRPGCDSVGKPLPKTPKYCKFHGSSLEYGFCERCMSE